MSLSCFTLKIHSGLLRFSEDAASGAAVQSIFSLETAVGTALDSMGQGAENFSALVSPDVAGSLSRAINSLRLKSSAAIFGFPQPIENQMPDITASSFDKLERDHADAAHYYLKQALHAISEVLGGEHTDAHILANNQQVIAAFITAAATEYLAAHLKLAAQDIRDGLAVGAGYARHT